MLAHPPEGTFDIDNERLPLKSSTTKSGVAPEQVPLLTHEEAAEEERNLVGSSASEKSKMKIILAFLYKKLKLKQILQPPIIASLFTRAWHILAMTLGAVPFLKKLICTPEAPLFFFTDSCMILGEAMIPCSLLALGGNLIDGKFRCVV
ncbi:protein PIN-LIKES 6-like [Cicer arietinum]|uniref:protein PIN-LIKES 6-like n=1 Tax=Cicer arietinum TaxID=3827 RepID=UPI003CC58336